ncbi:phage tail protein I [Vibrio parahaemolyticus]|nr:phage tail protein I [Vibrio parahaemolyticus]
MLPKILRNDIRMRALAELTIEEFNSLRAVIKRLDIMNVYEVDASFLPWLAWWFRVDAWDDEWSEERQRESIANALILKKYKGTIWAVERALELSMFDATVVPWYAMTPEGTRGTFRIDAAPSDSRSLMQSDYDTLISLTESNKQGSQHWKGNIIHDPSLGSAYAAPVVRTRKRWTSNNIVPLHVTGIAISPTSIIVYEGEPVSVSATVTMSDGTTTHDVRFESSDTSIVTVDESGLVSYVSEGNASVYAVSTFSETSKAESQIVAHPAPTLITISNVPELIIPDDSGTLIATVTYSNDTETNTSDDKNIVTWKSGDESVLTVDSDGNYIALSVGSATVTATSAEVDTISGSTDITVSKNFEQFSIVVQKKDVVGHPNIGVDYAQSYGEFSDDEWPNSTETKLALRARYNGGGMYLTYFVSTSQYESWRGWEGITITATHGSTSVSESLVRSTTGYSVRPEGNSPMYDFFDARVGETVDITLTEYVPTAEEKAMARMYSELGINF